MLVKEKNDKEVLRVLGFLLEGPRPVSLLEGYIQNEFVLP